MPFNGTLISVDSEPIFVNLGNRLGAYVVEQGETPYIVLHEKLKDDNSNNNQDDPSLPQAGAVYQALVDFHNSLPDIYRLFPLVKFYEDLPPPPPAITRPELILVGFFRVKQPNSRCYTWQREPEQDYRLIG